MVNKDVTLGADAREGLKNGINILANAVKATLGPKGRFVLIETEAGPHVTKDGVTVAKSIYLKDPIENMGAQLAKQAASKTATIAGDGTTTSTVLAQELVNLANEAIAKGAAPISITKGIEQAAELAYKKLDELKEEIDIKDWEKLVNVASISANNDREIGEIIANAFTFTGKDGVLAVEDSKTVDTFTEMVQGMQFENGYISPYFVTDPNKMVCEYDNAMFLLFDGAIKNPKYIVPILDKVAALNNTPLVLIAEEFDAQTLSLLVINKLRAGLNLVAVKSPAFGERRKQILEDIAILTGGTVISETQGITLDKVLVSHLGRAKKVKITSKATTIVDGLGEPAAIEARIEQLKEQLQNFTDSWNIEKYKERIAKLSKGVAVIKVGAITEAALKEKKDRIDDALHATRAALQSGIVLGGGMALLNIANSRAHHELGYVPYSDKSADEILGIEIFNKALTAPFRTILINAGINPNDVLTELIIPSDEMNLNNPNRGFDVKNEQYVDLKEAGIIDPLLVVKSALENAVSVANLMILTECTINISPVTPKENPYDTDLITV
jgi:chaperonin GroEL